MEVPRFLRPAPDVPAIVGERRDVLYRHTRARVLASVTVVYAFFYISRSALDVVKKPLIDAHIYDADQLGTISTFMLVAYALGKLINGFIADHVRVSRFLALGLGASAVMNVLMGFNRLYIVACALWMANGLFQGVGAATSARSLTQWFTFREYGRAYGTWSTAHSLGEGATLLVTATIVAHLGWKVGLITPGLACFVVAVSSLFVLRDRPRAHGLPEVHSWKGEAVVDTPGSTREAQWEVVSNPTVWVCALASALMYVTRYGVKSWGVLYLQEVRGYSLPSASAYIAMNAAAGLLGSIGYGFASDVLFKGKRAPATLLFGIVEILALVALFFGPTDGFVLTAALFVYGFSLSGILAVLGGLLAVDVSSKKAAGMAMGFIGFISYAGAAGQEKLSGMLLKAHTVVRSDGSTHIDDWSMPIALWIGGSVASMLVASTLWRVRTRR